MDRLLTSKGMKAVDEYTINQIGIPSMVLMERAALSVSEVIKNIVNKEQKILCICGTGNNGADTSAVARQLVCEGYKAYVVVVGDESKGSEEFATQIKIARQCGVIFFEPVTNAYDDAYNHICTFIKNECVVIVDGIFGIGLSREIQGTIKLLLEDIEKITKERSSAENKLNIVAVDVPSGLNATTGEIMGCVMKADYTVTFGSAKAGMYLYQGKDVCGRITVCDIGFPPGAYESDIIKENQSYNEIKNEDISRYLVRKAHTNKGSYGKVLIVAGSKGMYGAAYLAAMASFRAGVGLVRIVTHKENRELIYKMLPEAMIDTYESVEDIDKLGLEKSVEWADSVLVGPGISQEDTARELVRIVMEKSKILNKYLVIDADGLNIIAKDDSLRENYYENVIITPHIGEASRLMELEISQIARDIVSAALDYADKYNINVVLKDSTSVILGIESFGDKCNNRAYVNTSGNAGMAVAGSGDVLAGMIAGVVAGGLDRELVNEDLTKALAIAVYIHGMAGDMAAREKGQTSMTATDILDEIAKVLCTL